MSHDPHAQDPDAAPFNPIPPVVIALAAIIAGIEVLFSLGARGIIGGPEAVGWRLAAIQNWAVSDVVWEWMVTNNRWPVEHLARFVTYPLIHLNFTHALFVIVFLVTIGKLVAETFGSVAVLAVFFVCSITGGLAYTLILTTDYPLLGGYPGVYGLIGVFTFLMWANLASVGANQLRAFSFIGVLLGLQLVFAIVTDGPNDWVGDFAGFVTGFALSFVLVPGGWRRILDRMRKR